MHRPRSVSLKGELKVQKRTKPTADPKRAKWATRWIRLRGDLLAVYSDIMMWSEDIDTSGTATVKEAVHKVGTEDDAVETQDISSSGGETPTSLTPTTTPVLSPVTSSVRPPRSPTPFFDFDESFVITPPPSPGILSTSANVAASPLKKMLDGESGADVAKSKASTTGLANIALGALSLVSGATKLDGNTKLATRRCGVCLDFGVSSVQGKRGKMEDVHVTIADLNRRLELGDVFKGRLQSFFAVYDGHSGIEAAQYAAERIHTCLVREKNFETDVSRALVDCFRRVDQEYLEKVRGDIGDGKKGCYAGTTALTVLLRENKMYVATLGDTLAVLCRRGRACPVSVKCSPGSEMEQARIEKAGGWVIEEKELLVSRLHHMKLENESVRKYAHDSMRWLVTHRVNGELAVSRALGDPDYKGEGMAEYPWFFNEKHPKRDFKADLVIPVPLVQEIELVRGDMFVLIACDGLWDVLTLEDAVEVTKTWLDEGLSPQEASAKLTNLALMLGSGDNITAIVVCLDPSKLPTKGDEPKRKKDPIVSAIDEEARMSSNKDEEPVDGDASKVSRDATVGNIESHVSDGLDDGEPLKRLTASVLESRKNVLSYEDWVNMKRRDVPATPLQKSDPIRQGITLREDFNGHTISDVGVDDFRFFEPFVRQKREFQDGPVSIAAKIGFLYVDEKDLAKRSGLLRNMRRDSAVSYKVHPLDQRYLISEKEKTRGRDHFMQMQLPLNSVEWPRKDFVQEKVESNLKNVANSFAIPQGHDVQSTAGKVFPDNAYLNLIESAALPQPPRSARETMSWRDDSVTCHSFIMQQEDACLTTTYVHCFRWMKRCSHPALLHSIQDENIDDSDDNLDAQQFRRGGFLLSRPESDVETCKSMFWKWHRIRQNKLERYLRRADERNESSPELSIPLAKCKVRRAYDRGDPTVFTVTESTVGTIVITAQSHSLAEKWIQTLNRAKKAARKNAWMMKPRRTSTRHLLERVRTIASGESSMNKKISFKNVRQRLEGEFSMSRIEGMRERIEQVLIDSTTEDVTNDDNFGIDVGDAHIAEDYLSDDDSDSDDNESVSEETIGLRASCEQMEHLWVISKVTNSSESATHRTRRKHCLTCGKSDLERQSSGLVRRTPFSESERVAKVGLVGFLWALGKRSTRPGRLEFDWNHIITLVWEFVRPLDLRCVLPLPRCDAPVDRVCRAVAPLTLTVIFQCLLMDRKVVLMSDVLWKLADTSESVLSMMFPFKVKNSYAIYEPVIPRNEDLTWILQTPFAFCVGVMKEHLVRDGVMEDFEVDEKSDSNKKFRILNPLKNVFVTTAKRSSVTKSRRASSHKPRRYSSVDSSRSRESVSSTKKQRRTSTVRLKRDNKVEEFESIIFIDLDAGIKAGDLDDAQELLRQLDMGFAQRINIEDSVNGGIAKCGPFGPLPLRLHKRLLRSFRVGYGWYPPVLTTARSHEMRCSSDEDVDVEGNEQWDLSEASSKDRTASSAASDCVLACIQKCRSLRDVPKHNSDLQITCRSIASSQSRHARDGEGIVRWGFADVLTRLLLPFKASLRSNFNKKHMHRTRIDNLERLYRTLRTGRTPQMSEMFDVDKYVKFQGPVGAIERAFLYEICSSQMFVQFALEKVVYRVQNVFDGWIARRSMAISSQYHRCASQTAHGLFGCLTLLPHARLTSPSVAEAPPALALEVREGTGGIFHLESTISEWSASAKRGECALSNDILQVARDDVDPHKLLVFRSMGLRQRIILCDTYTARTPEHCEEMYHEIQEHLTATVSRENKVRRRSTLATHQKKKWNPLKNSDHLKPLLSRVRFSDKRKRRSVFGMRHLRWKEFFFRLVGSGCGCAVFEDALRNANPQTLLRFDHSSGAARIRHLSDMKREASQGEARLEWFQFPFGNILDEVSEFVMSQMPFYSSMSCARLKKSECSNGTRDRRKVLNSKLMIFCEQCAFSSEDDESVGAVYICETLDSKGCLVRTRVPWFQVIGKVHVSSHNTLDEDNARISRVIEHHRLMEGDVVEVCRSIVRSMGSTCYTVRDEYDAKPDSSLSGVVGTPDVLTKRKPKFRHMTIPSPLLKSPRPRTPEVSVLSNLDRLRRFDSFVEGSPSFPQSPFSIATSNGSIDSSRSNVGHASSSRGNRIKIKMDEGFVEYMKSIGINMQHHSLRNDALLQMDGEHFQWMFVRNVSTNLRREKICGDDLGAVVHFFRNFRENTRSPSDTTGVMKGSNVRVGRPTSSKHSGLKQNARSFGPSGLSFGKWDFSTLSETSTSSTGDSSTDGRTFAEVFDLNAIVSDEGRRQFDDVVLRMYELLFKRKPVDYMPLGLGDSRVFLPSIGVRSELMHSIVACSSLSSSQYQAHFFKIDGKSGRQLLLAAQTADVRFEWMRNLKYQSFRPGRYAQVVHMYDTNIRETPFIAEYIRGTYDLASARRMEKQERIFSIYKYHRSAQKRIEANKRVPTSYLAGIIKFLLLPPSTSTLAEKRVFVTKVVKDGAAFGFDVSDAMRRAVNAWSNTTSTVHAKDYAIEVVFIDFVLAKWESALMAIAKTNPRRILIAARAFATDVGLHPQYYSTGDAQALMLKELNRKLMIPSPLAKRSPVDIEDKDNVAATRSSVDSPTEPPGLASASIRLNQRREEPPTYDAPEPPEAAAILHDGSASWKDLLRRAPDSPRTLAASPPSQANSPTKKRGGRAGMSPVSFRRALESASTPPIAVRSTGKRGAIEFLKALRDVPKNENDSREIGDADEGGEE
eukprot:g1820.t1